MSSSRILGEDLLEDQKESDRPFRLVFNSEIAFVLSQTLYNEFESMYKRSRHIVLFHQQHLFSKTACPRTQFIIIDSAG